jgi:hypothetical protein
MVLNSSSDLTSVTPMVAVDTGKGFEGSEGVLSEQGTRDGGAK